MNIRLFHRLILLSAIPLLSLPHSSAQQALPTVNVIFEIAATQFTKNFDPGSQTQSEDELARDVADLCSDAFAFLNWKADLTPGTGPALKLVLRNQPVGYNDEIFVDYIAVNGTAERNLGPDFTTTIYEPTMLTLPTHKPAQLVADVAAKLRATLTNDGFQKKLHERFVCTVPIAQDLRFDSAKNRCVLPYRWDVLQAADATVLLARFDARPLAETDARTVQIRMAPERWGDDLMCRVFKFDYPPTNLVSPDGKELTDARIPQSFSEKTKDISVYVETYVRDFRANTSGPLSVSP